MFLARRPSQETIDRFLLESQDLPPVVRACRNRHNRDGAAQSRSADRRDWARRNGFRAGAGRTNRVEAVRDWLGRTLSAACTGCRRNRRGSCHSPPRVLVVERVPCSLYARRSGWCRPVRLRLRNPDEPRGVWRRAVRGVHRSTDRRSDVSNPRELTATGGAGANRPADCAGAAGALPASLGRGDDPRDAFQRRSCIRIYSAWQIVLQM
jgi:hypothetical protein